MVQVSPQIEGLFGFWAEMPGRLSLSARDNQRALEQSRMQKDPRRKHQLYVMWEGATDCSECE
jgi:hypothetical protein